MDDRLCGRQVWRHICEEPNIILQTLYANMKKATPPVLFSRIQDKTHSNNCYMAVESGYISEKGQLFTQQNDSHRLDQGHPDC